MHNGFIKTIKKLKPFLPTGTLLDTVILFISKSPREIGNIVLMNFMFFDFHIAKGYNLFTHFMCDNRNVNLKEDRGAL